jgi:hypothetical protein
MSVTERKTIMTRTHLKAAIVALLALSALLNAGPSRAAWQSHLVSGYVWANSPTASSYTPSPSYQFNSSGAANVVRRNGVGNYTVSFPNLGVNGGTALATAYGATVATCKVGSWLPFGTTLSLNVNCFNTAGAPIDTYFTASFSQAQSSAARVAYVWANNPTSPSYTPSTSYNFNPSGALNTITRLGTGYYDVQLPNMATSGGDVELTAYGSDSSRCKVSNWSPLGSTEYVYVRCYNTAGAPIDTYFTLTFASSTSIDGGPAVGSAYVWANNPTSPSYTPSSWYQFNSGGTVNSITRLGTGSYAVSLPLQNLGVGDVQVTAYGPGSQSCRVSSWTPGSGVVVSCTDTNGVPTDTYFDMAFLNA